MSKKKWMLIAICILLSVVCASMAFSQKVTISWWGWVSPDWVATYRAYEKLNPGVTIKEALVSEEWASTAEKFLAAVAAGVAPDASVQNSHEFPHYASQGVFLDLTPYVTKDGMNASDWFTPQWVGATFKGKRFGLPGITDTRVLYWNKKLFKDAGLDPEKPPATAKDLEADAVKLNKKDSSGKFVQYGFIPTIQTGMPGAGNAFMWLWLTSTGGEFVNADGTKYTVNNPKFVQAVDWATKFFDNYCGGAESVSAFLQSAAQGTQDPFNTQKLAMKVDGDWAYADLASLPDVNFGLAPVPVPDQAGAFRTTFSCGSMYTIGVNSKVADAAWKFIKWLSGPDGARVYAANALVERKKTWARQALPGEPIYFPQLFNNKPAIQALMSDYLPKLTPKSQGDFKVVTDSLNYTRTCAGLTGTGWGLTGLALFNELGDAFQQAVYHKKTAQQALDYANDRLNKGLAEAWQQVKIK